MIPREILKKIRQIELRTNRLVSETLAGQYHSVFKGQGMNFDEVREYQPGDDVRAIDWNVTARMNHPFIKKFVEERELTVALVVDASGSRDFGSVNRMKGEMAAEVSALLAFSAIKNNDRVGLLQFSDGIEKFVPARKGRKHVLRVIRELLYAAPESRGTDIAGALDYAMKVFSRRSVMFLISDFLSEGYERAVRRAAKRHDLVAIVTGDPREETLPSLGLLEVADAETGETLVIDTSDPRLRKEFSARAAARRENRKRFFRSSGIDFIELTTEKPYDVPLVRFFEARARRARA